VFLQVAGPTCADGAPGVFCCGLRVVSVDGTTTDVPDSQANDEYFGRPSNQTRDGAFPIRAMAESVGKANWSMRALAGGDPGGLGAERVRGHGAVRCPADRRPVRP
jgi:hypothetical protein